MNVFIMHVYHVQGHTNVFPDILSMALPISQFDHLFKVRRSILLFLLSLCHIHVIINTRYANYLLDSACRRLGSRQILPAASLHYKLF